MVDCHATPESHGFRIDRPDGVALGGDCRCPQGDPCVLFVHGFGQTRKAWTGAAETLAGKGCRTVSFDMRGHGESGRSPDGQYPIEPFLDDLIAVANAQPQPPVLVGASMGGLLGLGVAGEHQPPPFSALVLVDITPRWESAGVDRILQFMRTHPRGFASMDAAIDAVARYMPHRKGRKTSAQLAPLLRAGRDGRLFWHWDPAMLDSIADEGEKYQARLEQAARAIRIPTLLLSGERSDVVSAHTIEEFMTWVPHARHVEVAGATHMLAGDANDAFTREILRFIEPIFDTTSAGAAG